MGCVDGAGLVFCAPLAANEDEEVVVVVEEDELAAKFADGLS